MKTISDTATLETRRSVRIEFTHAEIAKILRRHLDITCRALPLDLTVVRESFDVGADHQDELHCVLTVDYHKVDDASPKPAAETPCYWTCVIVQKRMPDEIRYVFGASRSDVGRTLCHHYPHLMTWRYTLSATLPLGVKESEVLEVLK